ncbi:S9 family peptidase [Aggregicoccus sp. 17bor-14]|nr:S9 family peptidase [Aggregicoccus sp. 17bor-14]
MDYPPTRRVEQVDTLHGQQVADPYRWLEDEKSPEVQAWMKAQDTFARERLSQLPGRDALARRFTQLFYVESVTPPVKRGNRYFYLRTHKDREKAVLYVREGEAGAERVLLDPNAWSKDGTVSLGEWVPSEDGTKLAFAQKPNAADEAVLHVLDVASGTWSEQDVIEGAKYASPSWTPDGRAFYYEWLPVDPAIPVDARPGYTELRRHVLGQDPKQDAVVHPRTGDPGTFLEADLSRDGQYLLVNILRGWSENDVYMKRPQDKAWRLLVKGQGAKYQVQAWQGQLYILTDEGAPKQRLFRVSAKSPARAAWKEIVPEDPKASLQSFSIVGGRLVLEYLKNVASELRVAGLDGAGVRALQLPGLGATAGVSGQEDQPELFYGYSSFTTPRQVYRTRVDRAEAPVLWAKVELPLDANAYTAEQVFYESKDGTQVPMFLVYKKGLRKDGNAPTLLYGYGGFDVSLTPGFKSSIIPWLDAGGLYAVANLRGGGEFGAEWHEAGRREHKQNVFDDFIAAGEYLVKQGYTRPQRLAINGGSNGGLLVAAAMVQRPDLFGAVVCAVPLIDMLRYHLFGSGRTWIPEYGTAERAEDFAFLRAYSPYQQVKEGTQYPALLMLSADHDDRVDPLHARKFVAAIQSSPGNTAPALLRIERNAGHGGADQVNKAIASSADMFAFLFDTFGVTVPGMDGSASGKQGDGAAGSQADASGR